MASRDRRATPTKSIVADAPRIARRLDAWFRRHRRDLPWRRTRDPYAIWISETMLQQTRVAAAIPYYEAFLADFPTVAHLAAAPLERVLARWSGLGYYTRARNLHAAARVIHERHEGRFPSEPSALRALPGIGPYTSGAILSIAFDRPHPIVDGNVARVLSRVRAVAGDARTPRVAERLWRIAGELLPARAPGRFNEALMELGALVCTPRAPRCDACPLRPHCVAHARGQVERFPTPRARRTPVQRAAVAAIVESRRGVWLEEIRAGVNRGLHELPSAEDGADVPTDALWARLRRRLGVPRSSSRHLGTIRHGILERRYRVEVWHARVTTPSDGPWRRRDRLDSLPLTARTRRALALWEKTRA